MEVRKIQIAEIKRAPYNPRKTLAPGDAAYERMKKSILAFGLVEPLVWNEHNKVLIGGHQRLTILERELGITEVEVSVVNITRERDEKALNLALNKHAGEWDFVRLADLVQELDLGDFDMDITGFSEAELEKIAIWTPPNTGLTDENAVTPPPCRSRNQTRRPVDPRQTPAALRGFDKCHRCGAPIQRCGARAHGH